MNAGGARRERLHPARNGLRPRDHRNARGDRPAGDPARDLAHRARGLCAADGGLAQGRSQRGHPRGGVVETELSSLRKRSAQARADAWCNCRETSIFNAILADQCGGRASGSAIQFLPSGMSCGGTIFLVAARRRLRSPHHLADGGNRGCSSPRPLSASGRGGPRPERAGFTLVEALVALAVAAICLTAIGSLMAGNLRGSRRIEQHIALVETLRAVETGLPDRANLTAGALSGDMHGQAWSVDIAPLPDDGVNPRAAKAWTPQTVAVTVQSPTGARFQLETIRLVKRTAGQ